MKGRKVVVHEYKYIRGAGGGSLSKVAIGEGIFRAFGCAYEELPEGVGNFSTAIVEMPDGQIKNVSVELIVMGGNTATERSGKRR